MAANAVRKLSTAIDASPADGEVDAIAAAIQAEQAEVEDWQNDLYTERLQPLAMTLLNTEEKARRLLWKAADKHHLKMAAGKAMLDAAALEAGNAAKRTAMARDGDFAARGAAQAIFNKAAQATADEVSARYADAGAQCGADFENAFRALADAFDACWGDWTGPDAFRMGEFSLGDVYAETSLVNEIQTSLRPMSDALVTFERLKEAGDEKKISMFVRAARQVALKIRETSPAKLATQLDDSTRAKDTAQGQRDVAIRLLRAFDDYKREIQPSSLGATANLLGTARQHAFLIFGTSGPNYAVLAEWQIVGRTPTSNDDALTRAPWVVTPDFFTRYLPPNTMRLPGWSAPVMASKGGGIVRAPGGAR